jgi:hypothetical protein
MCLQMNTSFMKLTIFFSFDSISFSILAARIEISLIEMLLTKNGECDKQSVIHFEHSMESDLLF